MVGFGMEDICSNCGLVVPAEITDERRAAEEEVAQPPGAHQSRAWPPSGPGSRRDAVGGGAGVARRGAGGAYGDSWVVAGLLVTVGSFSADGSSFLGATTASGLPKDAE